jgi:hypothetical protein
MADKIIKNSAKCRKCGEIVESTPWNRRATCKCGALTVDGGLDQLLREGEYIEQSQYYLQETVV